MPEDCTNRSYSAKSALRLMAALAMLPFLAPAAPAQSALPLEDLVRQASQVFIGSVLKLNAGPATASGNRPALVMVNEVLYARPGAPDLTDKKVMVELSDSKSVKAGRRIAFFTTRAQAGDTIAVREVGHLDAVDNAAGLRQQIAGIAQKQQDERLQTRLASAELVVTGKLVNIKPADIPGQGTRDTPEWYDAEVEVQSVEKGQLPAKRLSFLFAPGADVKPEKALRLAGEGDSRLSNGQEGIWILHRHEVPRAGIGDRYTAADPMDFQAKDRLAAVRRMIPGAR